MLAQTNFLKYGPRLIVGLYVVLAIFYSLSVPHWEAPDEPGHFAYIRHLRETRTLPIQGQHAAGEAHQPPLYYAVAAIFTIPGDISSPVGQLRSNPNFMWGANGGNEVNINVRGTAQTVPFQGQAQAFQFARLASVAMGAATILLVMQIGRHIFPEQPGISLLASSLTALTPQFLFISSVLNNDNLLILCATGAIWQALQAIEQPEQRRQWVLIGLWLSGAVLTKLTAVSLIPLIGIVIIYVSWQRKSWRLFCEATGIVSGLMIVLTGWWFVRNQVLYGDLLGNMVYEQLFAANLRQNPLRWEDFQQLFSVQFRSFWATFGWMNITAPDWYFTGVRVVLVVAGIGWVVGWKRPFSPKQSVILIWLGLALLLQEATIFYIITRCNPSCYQGRYLFPAIGPIMLLISVGILKISSSPWSWQLGTVISLFFVAAAVGAPFYTITPAYGMIPEPGWHTWFGTEKIKANFNNQFVLHSYEQEQEATGILLKMYWQAVTKPDFDYSSFVHLVDASGQVVAQADAGLGQSISYLPTRWAAGDMVAELYNIKFPAGLPSGRYQIRTGIYNWISGERLLVFENQHPVGDFITLIEMTVR